MVIASSLMARTLWSFSYELGGPLDTTCPYHQLLCTWAEHLSSALLTVSSEGCGLWRVWPVGVA